MWRWIWSVVDIASIQDCVVHDEVPDDDTNFHLSVPYVIIEIGTFNGKIG